MALYRGVAGNESFLDRALHARWRIGWSAWHRGDHQIAREHFLEMVERESDPQGALRPRYWAARALEASGELAAGREELATIARDWPLNYYGWRAQQRLGRVDPRAGSASERVPTTVDALLQSELQRIALLVEAGLLVDARIELGPLAKRAASRADRVSVGRLLVAAGDYHAALRLVMDAYGESMARGVHAGEVASVPLALDSTQSSFVIPESPPPPKIVNRLVAGS